ncbi:DUF4224 domain-containing protein [Yersinia ruckeri]|uniref:DUF4224 domain-containing protein n=1 Tax=Yersinia ruckeri TaxID=29486 RepID=UPI0004E42F16|nr:DUF4224 domain-containing protein [Yersinia ruckeri]ARZ00500.1 hypothetical protein QMA0440_01156 [Yersinia ruckeri]EKN4689052.1 DUF4224 domain-containing protein [Yersinia ruckeri]KFE38119.1 putative excisionase [Yersinia ruckeri]MCK8585289.1 DUF4224 domain-containing protein [Yersinia ruckeri]MCW6524254.1 DUF4224 domain-containing protein [Yersinia ruckeri]
MTDKSDNDYLTLADVEHLTGYKKPSKQCEALSSLGVFYSRRSIDGRPVTTWYHWNNPEHLRLRTPVKINVDPEPNFDYLRTLNGKK